MSDPRPLLGEPLSLDLVNTRWVEGAAARDLLDGVPGLAVWLESAGLTGRCRADGATLREVRAAREAVLAAVREPRDLRALDEVLAHGRIRRAATPHGPADEVEVDDPARLAGWLAADDLLRLFAQGPHRVRNCAGPPCVLYFHDTSQNGRRRWCSMAACGNRAKAARHYDRVRRPNRG